MNEVFCVLLSLALYLSLLAMLLLPLRPVLDRRFTAASRGQLWYGLVFGLFYCWRMFLDNIRYSAYDSPLSWLNFRLPRAQLYWTEGALLPRLSGAPLLPRETARQTLEALPAGWSGDLSALKTAAEAVRRVDLTSVLLAVWLTGCLVMLLWYLVKHLAFLRMVKRWSLPPQSPVLLAEAERAEEEILGKVETLTGGPPRPARILICDRIAGPMVTGFCRKLLLLPREDYSPEEARCICRHELTHRKNGDLSWRVLFLIVNALFWFCPPVWLLRRYAYRDRELCCDETVLASADAAEKAAYCRVLLSAVPQAGGSASPFTTYFRGSGPSLRERLTQIWWEGKRWGKVGGFLLYFCAAMGMTIGAGFLFCIAPASALPAGTEILQEIQTGSTPESFTAYGDEGSWYSCWTDAWLEHLTRLPQGDPLRLAAYDADYHASAHRLSATQTGDGTSHEQVALWGLRLRPAEPDSPWFLLPTVEDGGEPGWVRCRLYYELAYDKEAFAWRCLDHWEDEPDWGWVQDPAFQDFLDE